MDKLAVHVRPLPLLPAMIGCTSATVCQATYYLDSRCDSIRQAHGLQQLLHMHWHGRAHIHGSKALAFAYQHAAAVQLQVLACSPAIQQRQLIR